MERTFSQKEKINKDWVKEAEILDLLNQRTVGYLLRGKKKSGDDLIRYLISRDASLKNAISITENKSGKPD